MATALLAVVCLTAGPSRAQPFGLDVAFQGEIGGVGIDARLTGSLDIGQGELEGTFQTLPPAIDGPSLAAMVFAIFTDTMLLPAMVPPEQTIFFLSRGNYRVHRDYFYDGFPDVQLHSDTFAWLDGSILKGHVDVHGQIPSGGGDSIISYNAWL